MKKTKWIFIYPIIVFMPLSQVAANPISDGDIEYFNMKDGETRGLGGWSVESGTAGSTNPSGSQFFGETDKGIQGNTMYMKDNAKVSQFVFHVVSTGYLYTLSFDVGYALGQTPQDYTIKVETFDGTAIEVLNPVRLQRSGRFEEVKLQFTNRETLSGLYTVSVETVGTGELHFDNFNMVETPYNSTTTSHLKTVAYGSSLYSAANDSLTCNASYSLTDSDGYETAYLTSGAGNCKCVNSQTVEMSETHYPSGDIRTFYQCQTGSN